MDLSDEILGNPRKFVDLPEQIHRKNSSNRKPAGRNRRIRAARRPQIAESPATRPLSFQKTFSEVPVSTPAHGRCYCKTRCRESANRALVKPIFEALIRKGRTWAIAVRRGSYASLFLLNSGCFSPEK